MRVITSGPKYLDIDAYACAVAYAELLNLLGEPAIAYSSAVLNESITPTILSWNSEFSTSYVPKSEDTFTIVDVSEPKYLDAVVAIDRVDEVIDHHVGFGDFWSAKRQTKVTLDFIGAAATLIYEKWIQADRFLDMSETSARLLLSAILDNTLNFQAAITSNRDHAAYAALLPIANLPEDWTSIYFSECQSKIMRDIQIALKNDTKMQTFKQLGGEEIAIGQLVIWDAREIVDTRIGELSSTMHDKSSWWFINVVSISEGISYFITDNNAIKEWAEKLLKVSFVDEVAKADRLWLRKEIVKEDLDTK